MGKETIKEKMATLKTQIDCLKIQFQDESKILFTEETKELFVKYPEMESFSWTQYTPYFNDGDTCEFGTHACEDCVDINGVGKYDSEEEQLPWFDEARNAVDKFVNQFEEEVLEKMFGDHVKVVVYKDKIETEGYEHD